MAINFSLGSVKDCILRNGGRIRNHELVTHFKSFLNDPVDKVVNREKFKDFVNELATIKVEEGEKVLVLKKKYRADSGSSTSLSLASSTPSVTKAESLASGDGLQSQTSNLQELHAQYDETPKRDRPVVLGDSSRAQSEPRDTIPSKEDMPDGGHMSKVYSDDSLEVKLKSTTRNVGLKPGSNASSASLASTIRGSQGSSSSVPASVGESVSGSGEDEANVSIQSVKERALHLNKMSSDAELQQSRAPQRKKVAQRDDDEESHTSGGSSFVTLSAEEKEWMVVCSTANYLDMHRLLSRKPNLAKVKNLSNTALHWAAKAGNSDVVKLLANKIGVNVNQRSGYTPLHLAAIHGHEDVIDLLVNTYKADVNIRDYSGKKPKQYLKNSASSQAQQLLVSRRLGADLGSARSVDDSFVRSTNARKSNRISSLLQATSPLMRHTSMRGNWDVVVEEREPGAQSLASPSMRRRRGTAKDKELMPPPQVPLSRRRQTDRTTSSSHDNLDAGPHLRDSDSSDLPYVQTVPRSESDPAMAKKSFS